MQVLVVDDNKDFSTTIGEIVESCGYKYKAINSPQEAVDYMPHNKDNIGLILLDIEFGENEDMNGLDLLEIFRRNYPIIPVVMISGKGTIESAVRATKLGAINFVEKSLVSKEKISEIIETALGKSSISAEKAEITRFLESNGIIGKSESMISLGDSIIRFGRTDLNIMITGETGTGKKLVAKAVHSISRRNKYKFVTVDIPNIPKELFQSELFGHLKGAFSGATETKKGLFHHANKGTLFMDEIGDLPLDLQANLLLPIEEKVVRKVGSIQPEEVDVRFISATDKDLVEAMKDSKFREQLYHRLRECEIHIPPLRQRREDIPIIIDYYVKQHNQDFNDSKFLSPTAIDFMKEQEWSGNVRELASVIRVAMQTTLKEQVEIPDLNKIMESKKSVNPNEQTNTASFLSSNTLKEDLAKVDKRKIEDTLLKNNGNVSKSAVLLGISRETLHNKIKKYEIDVQRYRGKGRKS